MSALVLSTSLYTLQIKRIELSILDHKLNIKENLIIQTQNQLFQHVTQRKICTRRSKTLIVHNHLMIYKIHKFKIKIHHAKLLKRIKFKGWKMNLALIFTFKSPPMEFIQTLISLQLSKALLDLYLNLFIPPSHLEWSKSFLWKVL